MPLVSPTTVQDCLILLEHLFRGYHSRNFAIRLWDGTLWPAESGSPAAFTLVIRHPGALKAMLFRANRLSLGEAYLSGDFDVEGDLEEVVSVAEYLSNLTLPIGDWIRYGKLLMSLGSETSASRDGPAALLNGARHSLQRDREAVRFHYDRPPEFYAAWLDRHMVYSCAYFADPGEDLDTAQARKLDYICRKLRLRPGERLLDVGCGWGALLLYAARHYGVQAVGITLSDQQAKYAENLIATSGLSDRCRVHVLDYRQLREWDSYDKVVSVGMVEHVGHTQLAAYFEQMFRLLKPYGVFLNHGIGTRHTEDVRLNAFSQRYIFPDAELVPPSKMLRAAEDAGFEVRDLESLREQYVLTLGHWRGRLESDGRGVMDDITWRIWRLYLAGTRYAFRTGSLNVYQTLLCKPANGMSGFPLTRRDWYSEDQASLVAPRCKTEKAD